MTNIIPEIGSTVEVVTTRPNTYYYTYKDQPTVTDTFIGKVIRNDRWLSADYVSVRTDNPNYPVSLIRLGSIKSIKIISGRSSNYKEFPVAGSKGKMYTVALNGKHYSCTCMGFTYNSKCKHIDLVRNDYYE